MCFLWKTVYHDAEHNEWLLIVTKRNFLYSFFNLPALHSCNFWHTYYLLTELNIWEMVEYFYKAEIIALIKNFSNNCIMVSKKKLAWFQPWGEGQSLTSESFICSKLLFHSIFMHIGNANSIFEIISHVV